VCVCVLTLLNITYVCIVVKKHAGTG
jgi:hypothetical protein